VESLFPATFGDAPEATSSQSLPTNQHQADRSVAPSFVSVPSGGGGDVAFPATFGGGVSPRLATQSSGLARSSGASVSPRQGMLRVC
jgi:hypothetical protein